MGFYKCKHNRPILLVANKPLGVFVWCPDCGAIEISRYENDSSESTYLGWVSPTGYASAMEKIKP